MNRTTTIKETRDDMRRVLPGLDRRWIDAASREVSAQLCRLVDTSLGRPVGHILAWAPHFPGEIDLSYFIAEQLSTREVYLPRLLPNRSMTFVSVGQGWRDELEPSAFGVPQPSHEAGSPFSIADARWTAVIVPGLVFDHNGNRLGRGAGYYDRFLGNPALGDMIKIGVCWALQMCNHVPVREHDVAMDFVCHERGWLKAGDSK